MCVHVSDVVLFCAALCVHVSDDVVLFCAALCVHVSDDVLFACVCSIWRVPNVNCVDSTGYTPLHHAALNGHRLVYSLLLLSTDWPCVCAYLHAWVAQSAYVVIHTAQMMPRRHAFYQAYSRPVC